MIVRSIHAHARIRGIDTAAARQAPGVVAIFTGADLAKEPLGTMQMTLKRKRPGRLADVGAGRITASPPSARAMSAIPSRW